MPGERVERSGENHVKLSLNVGISKLTTMPNVRYRGSQVRFFAYSSIRTMHVSLHHIRSGRFAHDRNYAECDGHDGRCDPRPPPSRVSQARHQEADTP
jgi:hypothetical protein